VLADTIATLVREKMQPLARKPSNFEIFNVFLKAFVFLPHLFKHSQSLPSQ